MAKTGQPGKAIGIAMADSTFNGILFGVLAFALLPFYAPVVYMFGTPELFMFMTLRLACVEFIITKILNLFLKRIIYSNIKYGFIYIIII